MFLFYRYFANMTTIQSNQYAKFHSNIRNNVNSNFHRIILNLGKCFMQKLIIDKVKISNFFLPGSIQLSFSHPLRIFHIDRHPALQCDEHIFPFYAYPSNDNSHHVRKYNLSLYKIYFENLIHLCQIC